MPTLNPPIPKYYRLATLLREQITDGTLQPQAQIPTEETLATTHNLSRGTVRQALRLLIDEGLLHREQGRGTFVAATIYHSHPFSIASFDDEMRRQNRTPSTHLLKFTTIPAPPPLAHRLEIQVETPIFVIERIRYADTLPVAHETRYLRESLCPALSTENLETQSIHWLLSTKYKIPLVRLVHTVELHNLSKPQAKLLSATAGTRAFTVDRLSFTTHPTHPDQKTPAVLFQAIYHQDRHNGVGAKYIAPPLT